MTIPPHMAISILLTNINIKGSENNFFSYTFSADELILLIFAFVFSLSSFLLPYFLSTNLRWEKNCLVLVILAVWSLKNEFLRMCSSRRTLNYECCVSFLLILSLRNVLDANRMDTFVRMR